MARQILGPRKRRTREHVIADRSVNHLERIILDEGHTGQRMTSDYGYDVAMATFDAQGFAEPGLVLFQLKASEALTPSGEFYWFDLDVRDYNLWRAERMPVVLVLYDAVARRAFWVHTQDYFAQGRAPARGGSKTVRVRIHRKQVLNRHAIRQLRRLKAEAMLGPVRR